MIAVINGMAGQAVARLASCHGIKVSGLVRRSEANVSHANGLVVIVDSAVDWAIESIRNLTEGKVSRLIFGTFGRPRFQLASRSLALGERQVFIAAMDKSVCFNLFEFFHDGRCYTGVETLVLDAAACASMLGELPPWFESGRLKPFSSEGGLYGVAGAARAYAESRVRLVRVSFCRLSREAPMHVTRSAKAPLYRMPGHYGMTIRQLQGDEAGPGSSVGLALLEIQPGGGAAAAPSPHEKIYFVQAGEVTISNGDHADVLKAGDSCRFAPYEIRKVRNDGEHPATLVLATALR
ncbi:hypothetical protein GCM10007874_37470 [Labrys miyagiensis]|uniref:Cupin type-2 domain-containing protein n=1 Tax=Labrys miyagiensis TaxID=346912 RepID=A0ABQ6CLN3_9HYPH|nr:cupin domain-containing protein [Labrys miyagiensis]GLS20730.1 hypothetical protein GCM10007874_37470 [Labrys miyagiensis]